MRSLCHTLTQSEVHTLPISTILFDVDDYRWSWKSVPPLSSLISKIFFVVIYSYNFALFDLVDQVQAMRLLHLILSVAMHALLLVH